MGCSPWGCKELGTTERLTQLGDNSVLFGKQRKNTSSRSEGGETQKTGREERPTAPLFIFYFSCP